MDKIITRAFNVCEWFSKVVYVNILWLLFTLAGIVLLGIMPATVALFTVVRKWTMSETEEPIFQTFFQTYKKEFLSANFLGIVLVAIGAFLVYDLRLVLSLGGNLQVLLGVPLLIIISCYLLTLLYLFPVYVNFELRFLHYFKYAFYISILNLHTTIFMLVVLLFYCVFLSFLPGFIPFISVSVISIVIMFGATIAIQRIAKKQEKYNQELNSSSNIR